MGLRENLFIILHMFQVMNYPSDHMSVLGSRNPDTSVLDWLPQRDPQVQILNFLDSNGLLPMRLEKIMSCSRVK